MKNLTDQALEEVASYFQVLSEPTRLKILNLLRTEEMSVGEIAQQVGFSTANVSRHLSQLAQQGLIRRASRGTSVYYAIADASVYELCDIVCGNIARQYEQAAQERAVFRRGQGLSRCSPGWAARLRVGGCWPCAG